MAQRRLLNKSLGGSRKFYDLNSKAGKLAEFCQALFPLIMANCDDHGRYIGDAFGIKNQVFPISPRAEPEFAEALAFLHEVCLIRLYGAGGRIYLYVINFRREQPGIKYIAKSLYPEPPPEVFEIERFAGTDQDSPVPVNPGVVTEKEKESNTKKKKEIEEKRREETHLSAGADTHEPSTEVDSEAACEPKKAQSMSHPGERLLAIYRQHNKSLPEVKVLTPDRKAKCRSRINQAVADGCLEQYLEDFGEAVRKAQQVPFLRGEGNRQWRASFDWFISNQRNVYAVLEGKYDNATSRSDENATVSGNRSADRRPFAGAPAYVPGKSS